MTTSRRRIRQDQVMFTGLAIILAALLVYFALSSIPSALRPTVQPIQTSTATTQP